jgi:hypothetical protein
VGWSNRRTAVPVLVIAVKETIFARIIRIARSTPDDPRVPYAFQKRVMTFVRLAIQQDIWSLWLPIMRKAAYVGMIVLALTGAYIKYADSRTPDLLAGDLERTVLASVNLDETW